MEGDLRWNTQAHGILEQCDHSAAVKEYRMPVEGNAQKGAVISGI